MQEIKLGGKKAAGRVVRVDDADYDLLIQHPWHVGETLRAPHKRLDGPYAKTCVVTPGAERPKETIMMHQMILGVKGVDHIDHDGLNNQRYNLRPANTAENSYNQRPQLGSSSRFKGVTWHKKCRKWQAVIKVSGRHVYLGLFESEEEAAAAYDIAAYDAYGDRAYLNGVAS